MKNLLMLTLALMLTKAATAQDIIVKRNGEEVQAKILTITSSEIKYKKFDNQEGPDFYMTKSEAFMIKYENGTKEVIQAQQLPQEKKTNSKTQVKQKPETNNEPPKVQTVKLSGPRIGATYIGKGETRDDLKELFGASPFITQFGWQFETKFFTTEEGTSGMIEFVPLVGGLEQGLFLPSASFLVAMREKNGYEFGVGPNVSISGFSLVFAAGTSFRSGGVNFPVNLAVVPSRQGTRISLVVGFNMVK